MGKPSRHTQRGSGVEDFVDCICYVLCSPESEVCDNIFCIPEIAVLTENQGINVVIDVRIWIPDELDPG